LELLAFALIIFTASAVLALRVRARGQPATNYVFMLVGLSASVAVTFALFAIPLGCGLWGFDHPPDWEQYLLAGAGLVGTLCGVAAAFFIAWRSDPTRARERREAEADYDEPEPSGPTSGPAPPP
jgi:hypothetical protein